MGNEVWEKFSAGLTKSAEKSNEKRIAETI